MFNILSHQGSLIKITPDLNEMVSLLLIFVLQQSFIKGLDLTLDALFNGNTAKQFISIH